MHVDLADIDKGGGAVETGQIKNGQVDKDLRLIRYILSHPCRPVRYGIERTWVVDQNGGSVRALPLSAERSL